VKKDIEKEYIAMSLAKKTYDQIRYIHNNGMECVRVNYANGNPEAVPTEKLQNKAKRYYFTDTIRLGRKEIFVSPLDLNIEHGKIEKPLKPMLRFGTPVFNNDGEKHGIVLLNYLAENLLDYIRERKIETTSEGMLLNTEGYWFLNPIKEKEWGFMFKNRDRLSFAVDYPKEWRMIGEQKSGQINTENGLFTFITIYPLQEGHISSSGSHSPYKPSVKTLNPTEYFWVLVSHIPLDVMKNYKQKLLKKIIPIGAGSFLLISFGLWQLAFAITKYRIYQARLIELAYYDSLTKLPNRKFFFDRLEKEMSLAHRHGRRLGLLYVDLDGFKKINDTMGHHAGDELLIKVGATLEKTLRKEDTVGRLGGDEFAVILSEIKVPENVKRVGEKIVSAMGQPFQLKAGIAQIGASVGAAIYPDHEVTMERLTKQADSAMYRAKAAGKGSCIMASTDA
jgi:diguanylate cyclase (GGDEF)-like protein